MEAWKVDHWQKPVDIVTDEITGLGNYCRTHVIGDGLDGGSKDMDCLKFRS